MHEYDKTVTAAFVKCMQGMPWMIALAAVGLENSGPETGAVKIIPILGTGGIPLKEFGRGSR